MADYNNDPPYYADTSGTEAGPGVAGAGAGNQGVEKDLTIIRYPNDLGAVWRHYMQIIILKQEKSGYSDATVTRSSYNWTASRGTGAGALSDPNAAGGIGKTTSGLTSAAGVGGAKLAGELGDGVKEWGGTAAAAATAGTLNVTRKASIPVAYIQLYMPDTLQFDTRQDFDTLGVTDALGSAGVVSNSVDNGGGAEVSAAAASKSQVLGNEKDVTNLYLMSKGYALNPQLEVLYKNPTNREFRYTFKFTPRNAIESQSVEDLITTLRFHASPEYANSDTSRYFIPPSEFRIEHMIGSLPNYHLPRIGQCVLQEVNVNYAASGQYSTFKDGSPIEIQMDLNFKEVNVLTKADIKAGF